MTLLQRIPVGIRARVYRFTVGATISLTSTAGVLAAVKRRLPAAVVAMMAGTLGTVSAVLAAANTPLDYEADLPRVRGLRRFKPGD